MLRIAAAAVQLPRDVPRSLERIATVVTAARGAGCSLLVLPAAAIGGVPDGTGDRVLPPDADEFDQLCAQAGDMVTCVGYTEAGVDGPVAAAICLSGDGVLGRYRAGTCPAAFETPIGRIGMLLDRDKAAPEPARTVATDGARLVACLCAWPAGSTPRTARLTQDNRSRLFDVFDSARAAENQVVWAAANQTGAVGALRFPGQAKVVAATGEVLARTRAKAGLAVAEVDPADVPQLNHS